MPAITDARPPDVVGEVTALQGALDAVIPASTAANLLIGTWHVRAFDRMSALWRSTTGDSPIRDLSNVVCIAEIARRFE